VLVSNKSLLGAVVAGCLLLSSCTGDEPGDERKDPPLVAPGAPGEPNSTIGEAPTPDGSADPDDLRFLAEMMIHHTQAVQMAELAPSRLKDPRVRRLAGRILAGQQPEIDAMGRMLSERGGDVPALEHAEHMDHSGMPGMASPAQLASLEQSTGAAFDRLFLTLMARHHEGALVMVHDVLKTGSDIRIEELATEIGVTQTKEISVMEGLLDNR
jgi:uncharacterized protein (DUF305 family)